MYGKYQYLKIQGFQGRYYKVVFKNRTGSLYFDKLTKTFTANMKQGTWLEYLRRGMENKQ